MMGKFVAPFFIMLNRHLGLLFLLLCLPLFLFGCKKKWQRIPNEKLEKLLGELYIAESTLKGMNIYDLKEDSVQSDVRKSIFEKYGVTEKDFDSTIYYLGQHRLDLLSEICSKSIHRIEQFQHLYLDSINKKSDPFGKYAQQIEQKFSDSLSIILPFVNFIANKGNSNISSSKIQLPFSFLKPISIHLSGILYGNFSPSSILIALEVTTPNGRTYEKAVHLKHEGAFSLYTSLDEVPRGTTVLVSFRPLLQDKTAFFQLGNLRIIPKQSPLDRIELQKLLQQQYPVPPFN